MWRWVGQEEVTLENLKNERMFGKSVLDYFCIHCGIDFGLWSLDIGSGHSLVDDE